jgi:hypothetical protein
MFQRNTNYALDDTGEEVYSLQEILSIQHSNCQLKKMKKLKRIARNCKNFSYQGYRRELVRIRDLYQDDGGRAQLYELIGKTFLKRPKYKLIKK